jgi:hypothetical protein
MPTSSLSLKGLRAYLKASRAPRYSVLFALPLLLAYEGLAALLTGKGRAVQVRNAADVLLKEAFMFAAGEHGQLIFMSAVIGISIWFVSRDLRRGGKLELATFGGMLLESVILALGFGVVIGTLTAQLLGSLHALSAHTLSIPSLVASPVLTQSITQMSWTTKLMLSLGAGLYEELLFRVLLVSGLAAGARHAFGMSTRAAGVLAAIAGALIFSAFHYIGPYGDRFQLQSFVFRAISGVAFSALYLLRGFGITAWTHALYDAFLLLR